MKNDVVTLIDILSTGEEIKTEVYAEVKSVGRNEFFSAAQTGLKPELLVIVNTSEYGEQQRVDIPSYMPRNGRFTVYRTYDRDDGDTELYLHKKVGVRK